MLPREIIWEDGQKYEIDRVIDIRPAYAAKAGGKAIVTPSKSMVQEHISILNDPPI